MVELGGAEALLETASSLGIERCEEAVPVRTVCHSATVRTAFAGEQVELGTGPDGRPGDATVDWGVPARGDPLVTIRLRITRPGPRRLRVAGELDMSSSPALAEELRRVAEEGEEGAVTLELSELTFLDSTGLRALIEASRLLGASGDLVLRHPTRAVLEVLEIAGVEAAVPNLRVERAD